MNQRFSKISTIWTVLEQAHGDEAELAAKARKAIVELYGGAVHRYLLAAVRDPGEADDLYQEFALGLVRGDFRKADPQKGRFQNYVKVVLFHLVSRHRQRLQRIPRPLSPDAVEISTIAAPADDADRMFDRSWREQLLTRAWHALARTRPTFHAVLRFRADHPDMPSGQMAEEISRQFGKPITPDSVRQTLHRARDLFAELLLDEVAQSLRTPDNEHLEQELRALDLLEYCRRALEKYPAERV